MITNVQFTVCLADGKKIRRRLRTLPRTQLSPEGLEALLTEEASFVEKCFPGREFRLVALAGRAFNFVETQGPSAALETTGEVQCENIGA
jgi:hypothetical protein